MPGNSWAHNKPWLLWIFKRLSIKRHRTYIGCFTDAWDSSQSAPWALRSLLTIGAKRCSHCYHLPSINTFTVVAPWQRSIKTRGYKNRVLRGDLFFLKRISTFKKINGTPFCWFNCKLNLFQNFDGQRGLALLEIGGGGAWSPTLQIPPST